MSELEFFDRNLLVHTHIEKTAGTSLVQGLSDAFSPAHVLDTRPSRGRYLRLVDPRRRGSIWLLSGHFAHGRWRLLLDRRPVYIACVREPVARFRSFFNFVQKRSDHPAHRLFAGLSFGQGVRAALRRRHYSADNPMTRTLGGPDFESRYLIVIPSERVNEASAALAGLFGLSCGPARANVERYRLDEDRSATDAFLSRNRQDAATYELVVSRFDKWLTELPDRLRAFAA